MEYEAYFLVVRAVSAKGLTPNSEMLLISLRQALNVPDTYHMDCLMRLAEDGEFEALQNELAGGAPAAAPPPSAKPPKGRRHDMPLEPSVMSGALSGAAKAGKKRLRPADTSFLPSGPAHVPHILPPNAEVPKPAGRAGGRGRGRGRIQAGTATASTTATATAVHITPSPAARKKGRAPSTIATSGHTLALPGTANLTRIGDIGGTPTSQRSGAGGAAGGTGGQGVSSRVAALPAMSSDAAGTQQKLKRRASGIPGMGSGKRAIIQAPMAAAVVEAPSVPYKPEHFAACLQRGDAAELRPLLAALDSREEQLVQQIKQMGEELRRAFEPQPTPVVHLAGKRMDRAPYPQDIISGALNTATQQQLEDMLTALDQRERSVLQQIQAMGLPTTDLDGDMQKALKAAELEQRQERLLKEIMEIDNTIMTF